MVAIKDITWIADPGKYANGQHGYIGKVKVGSVRWYGMSKHSPNYMAVNIVGKEKGFDTLEDGKAWVGRCLKALVAVITVNDEGV